MNLTPIFDEYLRHADLPTLELKFDEGSVSYRWNTDDKDFAMPVPVGTKDHWQVIQPMPEWKSLKQVEFEVATDLYFVNVSQ